MTRLKKELIKKTSTVASTERIGRIKDQKKVVNSKHNVKISEFHVKQLLESVESEPELPAGFDNNNGDDKQPSSTVSKNTTPGVFYTPVTPLLLIVKYLYNITM